MWALPAPPQPDLKYVQPGLKYVQVQKKRDDKGRLEEIKYSIVYGTAQAVGQVFENAVRCKTINTVYVESRNGKFRKDDAQANFLAQVMNYTRTNDGLKIKINPDAALFEQKYKHQTPAMAQNLIDKPLTIKELLLWRPQITP